MGAFASTNLGDVSPNTRGPKCEFSGKNCSDQYTCPGKKEMCFASGPGKDMFESTSIIAHKIYQESLVSMSFHFMLPLSARILPGISSFICPQNIYHNNVISNAT